MIILKAHLKSTGQPITLYLSTNFAVWTHEGVTHVSDGVNNNGGWMLRESQSDLELSIKESMS